jgi:Bax protein
MYSQKQIIKLLVWTVILQLFLFVIYYVYINFLRNIYTPKIIPHSHIVSKKSEQNFTAPPPTTIQISKTPEYEVIQKKLTQKLKRVTPKSTQDIVPIKNKKVKPILYTKSIPLKDLTIEEKKEKFIDMIVPSILVAKHQLKYEQERVATLLLQDSISIEDEEWLAQKRKKFQALDNYELYDKMETHPTSIIIAQAILESGWGTSKFFQKANNIFGVWSFNANEKRIRASKKRGNKTIYLKKYQNMEASIYDYLLTLSKNDNYKKFREERLKTKNPYKLVDYLIKYSEDREVYTKKIKNMIKNNKLAIYDKYELDL